MGKKFFRSSPVELTGLTDQLEALYKLSDHDGCDHSQLLTLSDDELDKIFEDLAREMHDSGWDEKSIPRDLYFKTAQKLSAAITEGVKRDPAYDDPMNAFAAQLRANVYQFSGAKSLLQAIAMQELMLDSEGNLKPFKTFLNDVKAIHGKYNERYLAAEYSNAVASSQMATKWKDFEALGGDPILTYSTAGDERVRPKHAALDGISQPMSSSFWDYAWPPTDWLCRCDAVPGDQSSHTAAEAGKIAKQNVTNPIFQTNVGKTGIVFSGEHIYYQSLKRIRELDAIRNYGLKSMTSIMKNAEDYPASMHIDTETDYYIWWKKMIEKHGVSETDFVLQDKLGSKVLFESRPGNKSNDFFRDHIIKKKSEKRHEYAGNFEGALTEPDEIWYKKVKGAHEWQYIKYHSDGVYILSVVKDGDLLKAQTFYKVDPSNYSSGQIRKKRTGVLLHKK
jgi:SPP1 gp7 family putative phage head morphogenesis protein